MIVRMVDNNFANGVTAKSFLSNMIGVSEDELEVISAENDVRREAYNKKIRESYEALSSEEKAAIAEQSLKEYDEVFSSDDE